MTSLPLLLLLVLFGSLHACTPRPLAEKDTANYNFDKGLDKEKLLVLTASSVKDYTLEEHQVQEQKVTEKDVNMCEHCSSASNSQEMNLGAASGRSFQTDSQSSLVAEKAMRHMVVLDERRHGRSMLGPARHHVEEIVVTNDSDNAEDIVEMDYANPHKKPPIHNEKP